MQQDRFSTIRRKIEGDHESGSASPLTSYAELFPGEDALVARAYSEVVAAERLASIEPGEGSIGPYRPLRELGRGGQGVVYLAEDTRLHRKVALKVLTGLGPGSQETLGRFRREAEVASKLNHPGICAVHDAGVTEGIPFIAMQYVEGSSLAERIAQARSEAAGGDASFAIAFSETTIEAQEHHEEESGSPGPTSAVARRDILDTLRVFEDAARALHAAHEAGIIHRDIKPANIMLSDDGQPVVLDFGLARSDGPGHVTLTQTGDFFGTPAYMPPEQISESTMQLDRRSDVYSLGASLFECLTLRKPFDAPTREALYQAIMTRDAPDVRTLVPAIPNDLAVVVQTAMEKDRDRRYQTALELAEELRRVGAREPIHARPASVLLKTTRWVQRNPAVAIAIAGIVVMSLVAAGVFYVKGTEARHERDEARLARTLAEKETRLKSIALDEKAVALADVERLADMKKYEQASQRAADLWPARPHMTKAFEKWLAEYEELVASLPRHQESLTRLRSSAVKSRDSWDFGGDTVKLWKHDVLTELVDKLRAFSGEETGIYADVKKRLATSLVISERTISDHAALWQESATAILSSDLYDGLKLEPQVGLIPLGEDPESGLQEFLHWETHTGALPARDRNGELQRNENTGIILVLIPAGTYWMGTQREDPHGKNYDPGRTPEEALREVTIEVPFFLSKFEMTQGQWQRSPAADRNPSTYASGASYPGHRGSVTLLNPVESVSWTTCTEVMRRIGLRLPDEERWEYAARAGASSIWVGNTDTVGDIPEWGNIAGDECTGRFPTASSSIRDAYLVHAPGGRFRANDFGLFDILGNVWEWTSTDTGTPDYITRGGSFYVTPAYCRLATRITISRDQLNGHLGLRPMCEVR